MPDLTIKRHDHGRQMWFTVIDQDGAVDLSTAASVTLYLRTGTTLVDLVATKDPDQVANKGRAYVVPTAAETATDDSYDAEVEVIWGDGSKETFPNDSYRSVTIFADLNDT